MMFVNSGDPLPELAIVVLVRWIWRYRSELAPIGVAYLVVGVGWYARTAIAAWWPWLLCGSGVAAWLLGTFGARIGIPTFLERLYVAVTVLMCGIWDALAAAVGPFTAPLPQMLGIGGLVLSLPWWVNRRRRAKVRLERTLAAWPDISRAVGLPGSEVMSATLGLWGWRARLRLARGQTLEDVIAKIRSLESALGTHRGAIRVYPTADDLANRCELRVLSSDPHANAINWPGPSVTSVTQPIDLGPFEDAESCRVLFLRRHSIIGGTTGSGKSGAVNVLMANLSACRDAVIWAIDLKKGMELKAWAPCINRLATTPEEATALLRDAVAILQARAEMLATNGRRTWEPTPDMPALVIVIDEYAELKESAPDAMSDADSIARLGRAVAVTLAAATQRPTQKAMGEGAVRSQMDVRICFRVRERRDVDLVLGQGMLSAGWAAHKLNAPGKFLVSAPEHDTPKRARAYLITDQAVSDTAQRHAPLRPELDEVSRRALGDPSQPVVIVGEVLQTEDDELSTPEPQEYDPETVLWDVLSKAPEDGISVPDLVAATHKSRRWIYYRLRALAAEGRVIQTAWGRWQIVSQDGNHG
jgi:S-DNA-T family DNA segregation ATPase FtsK/SpoIIIE